MIFLLLARLISWSIAFGMLLLFMTGKSLIFLVIGKFGERLGQLHEGGPPYKSNILGQTNCSNIPAQLIWSGTLTCEISVSWFFHSDVNRFRLTKRVTTILFQCDSNYIH